MSPCAPAARSVTRFLFCLAGASIAPVLASTPDDLRAPAPLSVSSEWHRSTFGEDVGTAGLYVADLAGTGQMRVVAAASRWGSGNRFWYVLVHRDGKYVHEWTSPHYPDLIAALRVVNLDGDDALEVVVAAGNRIYVYDGATYLLERSFPTAASVISAAEVADVDSDGQPEVVLCDSDRLYVYNAATGAQEYESAGGLGGVDLAVGNVDLDPAQEIVITPDYGTGFVVDGKTHAVEWSNPWGSGTQVALGDLDGDGRSEAAVGDYGELRIFDVELHSLAATVPTNSSVRALQVSDIDGDGPLEIVYRDGGGGRIWVLDGSSRAVKWSVPASSGDGEVAFGDSDNDGTTELAWGSYPRMAVGPLTVWNAVTRLPEWTALDVRGPFQALSWGDVDGDGGPEIVSGSFESDGGYGDGLWFVNDARTHSEEFQSGPTTGSNRTGITRVRNMNIDLDPQQEIFVATSLSYSTGLIICYDGVSHGEEWRAALPYGYRVESMALGDVDLDGEQELVAGVIGVGANGDVFVLVFDAATGAEEWMSPTLSQWGALALLRIANVDGDPQPEILVGSSFSGALFLIDEVTQVINHLGSRDVSALDTPDRNGDGVAEIVIGTWSGAIQVLNTHGVVVQTIGNFGGRIEGLAWADLDLDHRSDYAYAVNNEVFIRSGADGSVLWQSGLIGDSVGTDDSLYIADVDEDGAQELLVNIGSTGFRLYGISTDRIFTDGFE